MIYQHLGYYMTTLFLKPVVYVSIFLGKKVQFLLFRIFDIQNRVSVLFYYACYFCLCVLA